MAISLYRTDVSEVAVGGTAVTIVFGPVAGGLISNPLLAEDQGIDVVEVLFVNVIDEAEAAEAGTTFALQPGQSYRIIPGQTTNVSVNALTSGHKFSGIVYQEPTPYPPAPQPGNFPPSAPVTLTEIIPAYIYRQYADDEDLQAFVAAYNELAQEYLTWFATIGLPIYTQPQISGPLLDWVAAGLYGQIRPSLSSGRNRDLGPLNTYAYNTMTYNGRKTVGPQNLTVTTDDVFRRIITWNFYKGDGKVFNIRWLKRRIMRFLIGLNGTAPNIDQTYLVSITFGADRIVSIRIAVGTRSVLGGALYNRFGLNTTPYNSILTKFNPSPTPLPLQSVLKEAIDSGALQLPFQFTFSVSI